MKTCPQCDSGYPDSHTACPIHGHLLNEIRDLRPGMVIHKTYRILRKLGQGGMGAVYLAQHILMDEPRALKFLSPELSSDQAFTGRFLREVRTLRQIRNRNVVDCGDLEAAEDDSLFFSMEFVDGPDLRGLLNACHPERTLSAAKGESKDLHLPSGALPVPLALSIARQIAEGLGAAHSKGMVHRDIKPENILMARDGDTWLPKIADFGIVATKESSTAYTRTGGTLLTMAYAAPEQWRGTPAAELDGRTDLYALGGLLYEMLTGQTAFHAENYEGWARQHQTTPPQPPSTLRPNLAHWQGLDALVLRLLAKDRNDRPKDVAELISLLDVVRLIPPESHQETVIEDGGKRSRLIPVWVWSTAFFMVLVAALALWFTSQRAKQPTESTIQTSPAVRPQPVMPQPAHPQPTQLANSKPTNPQPGSPQEPKPAQVEVPKPTVQQPSTAEIDKQAGLLYDQKRFADAAPLYYQACSGGLGADCNRLGTMYEHGDGVAQDYSQAATFYAKACVAGDKTGCDALIPMYVKGTVTAQDVSRVETLFSNACNAGNAHGCASLGFMYERGAGVAKDASRAATLYSKACDASDVRACLNLGFMYQNGNGVPKDTFRAATLYSKSCDLGDAMGCSNLGVQYGNGSGVEQDYSKAAMLFTKSCDAGYVMGCNNLGLFYLSGHGVTKDYSRAQSLFSKACGGGYSGGCGNLGVMYEYGQGVVQDYSRAAMLYAKGCDGGNSESCSNLGNLYRNGNGVSKDIEKAKQFFNKGCSMGNRWGCDRLKELQ